MDLSTRSGALEELANLHKSNRVREAIASLRRLDATGASLPVFADLGTLLAANPVADLTAAEATLKQLASEAKLAPVRRAGMAGRVVAEGKPDTLWGETASHPEDRIALIDSIILLMDPAFRATFQPLLTSVIDNAGAPQSVREAALRALPLMGPDNAARSFGILAQNLQDKRHLTTAARAVTQLPRDVWGKEQAGPAAEAILAWARTVPASERAKQEFVETTQVGMELAALLPAPQSTAIRKELLGLGVRVLVVKTVREQMRYDTTRLVVEAGKPFQIIFENLDMMPHNLVIVQPGAREEVGVQAQTMPPHPDRQGKMYVPKNSKILASSKLIEAQQKETLELTAPEKLGTYEYVCTYPEHWKTMFGELVVVKDLTGFMEATAVASSAPAQSPSTHQHNH